MQKVLIVKEKIKLHKLQVFFLPEIADHEELTDLTRQKKLHRLCIKYISGIFIIFWHI